MSKSQSPFNTKFSRSRRAFISAAIALSALGLAYAPLPGLNHTVTVVSGTELQEILPALEAKFEQQNPSINLELKFQGSQDIVNNVIDNQNDFVPTIVVPANSESLTELSDRWKAQNNSDPFYDDPQPIAETFLVAIAWTDRGKVLFPNNQFDWNQLEKALQAGDWKTLGEKAEWGSFDFVITDPTRSNSAQLALGLWAATKTGSSTLDATTLNMPEIDALFSLVKRSVYQPPRSTDVLLQEFISRGPNDADVAIIYESIALNRWQQSATQGKPYQIYYLNPTIATTSTAAILRQGVDSGTADAARKFLNFLTQAEQQAVFVQYGFRPVSDIPDLSTVPNSPWSQNIPGASVTPPAMIPTPDSKTLTEIIRIWQRAS